MTQRSSIPGHTGSQISLAAAGPQLSQAQAAAEQDSKLSDRPPMKNSFRYIVLGLGGLGSAACYWLSRKAGSDVLGMEQFELGHDRGESQDHSRIIRLTYHTVPYVHLAKQAFDAWSVLEEESGEQIVLKCGEINFWPPETTLVEHLYTDSMAACGVPVETLDNMEIMRQFQQFRIGDEIHGIYQPQGGLVAAVKGNAAHQHLARLHGAMLVDRLPVTGIRHVGGEYELRTKDETFRCEKLVIAAGPWSNKVLAHFGMQLPLKVTQEQVTYFSGPHLSEFLPDRFPVWIWMIEDNYYGFPVYGAQGVSRQRRTSLPPSTRTGGRSSAIPTTNTRFEVSWAGICRVPLARSSIPRHAC